jgi:hypothetical protein
MGQLLRDADRGIFHSTARGRFGTTRQPAGDAARAVSDAVESKAVPGFYGCGIFPA